jgi:hypothetical protein
MTIDRILSIVTSFLNFIKTLFLSKYVVNFKRKSKNTTLSILANGPSLSEILTNYKSLEGDLLVVNLFHKTDYFSILMPPYYLISAPEFWLPLESDLYKNMQKELEESLQIKVSWPMTFFIPYKSKKFKYKSKIEQLNSNITVRYYNDTAIDGYSILDKLLMNFKLAMPRPHNVLIPSLMTGIWMGYSTINLYGVDHSWLPQISVNNENQALVNQQHFYDAQTSTHQVMTKKGEGSRRLHEILHKFQLTFKSYHDINRFARSCGSKIINHTKGSYIDAFERA